jgi:hypothetical protein
VIPEPHKRLYREFGVESSLWSVLDPRALPAQIRGLFAKRRKLALDMHGGIFGLPADFLIAPDGHVRAVSTGTLPMTSGPSMNCSPSQGD